MVKPSFILERKVIRLTNETDVQIKEMGIISPSQELRVEGQTIFSHASDTTTRVTCTAQHWSQKEERAVWTEICAPSLDDPSLSC